MLKSPCMSRYKRSLFFLFVSCGIYLFLAICPYLCLDAKAAVSNHACCPNMPSPMHDSSSEHCLSCATPTDFVLSDIPLSVSANWVLVAPILGILDFSPKFLLLAGNFSSRSPPVPQRPIYLLKQSLLF